ncbi:MAG: hypothetical protein GQ574_18355 [Crocinitomix sp.]|nr:hypothetical protein [Crocinitomix sp.]
MKKLVLLFAVLFTALGAMAQPPSIKVVNETDCMMYVLLYEVDGACSITTHNVAVPANSTFLVNAVVGGHFEFALVTDTFGPYDLSCYYVKVQVPWATCVSGYAPTMVGSTCCASSPTVKSTWEHPYSSAAQPYLFIYD